MKAWSEVSPWWRPHRAWMVALCGAVLSLVLAPPSASGPTGTTQSSGAFSGLSNQSGIVHAEANIENAFGRVVGQVTVDVPYQCSQCVCTVDEDKAVVAGGTLTQTCELAEEPKCHTATCPSTPGCPNAVGEACVIKVECCLRILDRKFLCSTQVAKIRVCP